MPTQLSYTINGRTFIASDLTLGLENVTFITELEDKQVFYRVKWQGEITFVGDDYRRFWAIFSATCCQPIVVNYYRLSAGCSADSPYWTGTFNLSELNFDTEKETAELSKAPRVDDGYQTLLEYWDTKVNWLDINQYLQAVISSDRTLVYRRARYLNRVIEGMCRLTLTGTKAASLIPYFESFPISTFLDADTNPVTRRKNPFKYAMLIQASDFLAPDAVGAPPKSYGWATRAEWTLKEMIEDLQELCDLYPHIDPVTGKLRWEHLSYYPGLTYDQQDVSYQILADDPVWNGHRQVKTNTDELYGLYTLTIEPNTIIGDGRINDTPNSDANFPRTVPDFGEGNIEFSDACVARLPTEEPVSRQRVVKRLATDLFARFNPDVVDKAGWIFLVSVTYQNSEFQVAGAIAEMMNQPVENGAFAASSLVRDFHRHNQSFASGIMNRQVNANPKGFRRGMKSVMPVRELAPITVSHCCTDTLSLNGLIQTWYGANGILKRAEYKPATDQLTLQILHPGPCQVPQNTDPYDPDENPGNCPPRGEYLRTDYRYFYNQQGQVCEVQTVEFLTDGKCGEYESVNVSSSGSCD